MPRYSACFVGDADAAADFATELDLDLSTSIVRMIELIAQEEGRGDK